MQQKKIPMRQCLGCREMRPKRDLIRIVRSPEGQISIDFRGKVSGRGAYICKTSSCLRKAIKGKAFERSFGCSIPAEVYEALEKEMDINADE